MLDRIMLITCAHIFGLFWVDYFDLHNFGIEACLPILTALVQTILHMRDKK